MEQMGSAHWKQYPHWARGPARIVEDKVVLDEERAEKYYLYEPTDLLFDLADLGSDPFDRNSKEIVAFVRRYGLLWHGADGVGSGECSEPLRKWWEEARLLALVGDFSVRLRQSLASGTTEPIRNAPIEWLKAFAEVAPHDEGLLDQASVFLAESISMNLKGCDFGIVSSVMLDVQPNGPGVFLLSANPPDLVSAAYSQLARAIVDRAPLKECLGCGRMFVPRSGKQKFHSKSCANTSRWRRWNEKQTS